jgi:hypothetical protein
VCVPGIHFKVPLACLLITARDSTQVCPSERSQISRNNLTFHSYSRWRVFGTEFVMTVKMVIAPLTFVSLAVLLVYTEPHIPCVVMVLAKLAGHVSL